MCKVIDSAGGVLASFGGVFFCVFSFFLCEGFWVGLVGLLVGLCVVWGGGVCVSRF